MAKRKHKQYRVIDTERVQGEGSFVKIKNLNISEIVSLTNPSQNGGKPTQEEAAELGLKVLDYMIVDWNWVDDDDNPLPIPAENPGTIKSLPFQETTFLLEETGVSDLFNTKN